jgi:hypothetical protein
MVVFFTSYGEQPNSPAIRDQDTYLSLHQHLQ